eukprot:SAG22_NODE_87_length_21437_cov_14.162480_13_plen_257_part_00
MRRPRHLPLERGRPGAFPAPRRLLPSPLHEGAPPSPPMSSSPRGGDEPTAEAGGAAGAKGDSAADLLEKPEEPIDEPSAGGYALYVTILEGRQLMAMDPDGSSDPYVTCALDVTGEKKETTHHTKTLNPIFMEDLAFEFRVDDPLALSTAAFKIDVMDSDTFRDELIGSYTVELGTVWYKSAQHALSRQWLALMDSNMERTGVQGYLKVTMLLVEDGQPMPVRATYACLLSAYMGQSSYFAARWLPRKRDRGCRAD